MSEEIESMALVAEGMRELADPELDAAFGGVSCHPATTDCTGPYCEPGMPGYSYDVCWWYQFPACRTEAYFDGLSC